MLPVLIQRMKPPPVLYPPLLRLVLSLARYKTGCYALASFAFYAYAAPTFAPSFSGPLLSIGNYIKKGRQEVNLFI